MGFFSDLKDDLSQAVNEMLPEDEVNGAAADEALPDVDLSSMLDNLEAMNLDKTAPETVEEEKYSAPAAYEPAPEPEPEVKAPAKAVEEFLANDAPAVAERKQVLDETAVITMGMEITGDISTQGSIDLIGRLVGNISALGKLNITGAVRGNSQAAEIYAEGAQINGDVVSEGAVKVGQSTVIIGNITATSAVIAGAVKGDIDVRGPVILDGSAIVMGNIKSKYVQINNGAVIEGMCSQCYADVNPTSFFEELKKSF